MPIRFTCPHCGTITDVADQYIGQSGPCIRCRKQITIPGSAGASPFASAGLPPKRGLSVGMTLLIILLASLPVILVCGGILLALLLPAVGSGREAARRIQCCNNLKQIGLAMHNYEQQYGCFPPVYIADKDGKPMHSWRVLILPYLEQQSLYKEYRFDEPWDGPNNSKLASRMPTVYRCPTEFMQGTSLTSYAMIVGPHAISDGPTGRRFKDITDIYGTTIMVTECAGAGINWLDPRDINTEEMTFRIGSYNRNSKPDKPDIRTDHNGKVNALMCDGSVRLLPQDIAPDTLKAMTTIDGGENVTPPDF